MLIFTDEEMFETLSDLRGLPAKEIKKEYINKPEKLLKLRSSYRQLFDDLISITIGTSNETSDTSIIEPF